MSDIVRNYEYISEQKDIERVRNWLEPRKFFALDLETSALNPFRDEIILLQVGDEEKQWIIDVRAVDISSLKESIVNPKITKLGQNIKFDLKYIMWKYGWWDIENVADTMIAEQILRCGLYPKVSMEELALRYLKLQIDKDENLRQSFRYTEIGHFSERQLDYASGDLIYPILIARKQKPLITQRGLTETLILEHQVLPVIARMELYGMLVDKTAWNKLYQEAVIKKMEAENKLNKFFDIKTMFQETLFEGPESIKTIDYDSSKQLKEALEKLGYFLDDTSKESIALAYINGMMPRELAQSILDYRVYNTRITRYGINFLDAIEPSTGRIHSDFKQAFTTTGRLSSGEDEESESDKVNLQNIPSNSEYRGCFIPRPGYVFIVYDYQAIEPRILGEISNDPTYVNAFINDKDIYGEVGTKIYEEPVNKSPGRPSDLRAKTKITVLGNSYGTGKKKFFRKMQIDLNLIKGVLNEKIVEVRQEDSDLLWDRFFEVCPGIRSSLDKLSSLADTLNSRRVFYDEIVAAEPFNQVYAKMLKSLTKFERSSFEDAEGKAKKYATTKHGYVTYSETLGGRKRFFRCYHSTWWTEGRNHPIQGTGADILKTAMFIVDREIRNRKSDARIVNQVHDELIVECKKEEAVEVDKYVKPLLIKAGSRYLKKVKCVVEGGIKTKWEK